MRSLAVAYRALPPVELATVAVQGNSPVVVRSGAWGGKTYASAVNPTPFDQALTVSLGAERQELKLAPFELKSLQAQGTVAVAASGQAAGQYVQWLNDRLSRYAQTLDEVRALDPAAAPAQFANHLSRARDLMASGRLREMDMQFGFGLQTELDLRKRILAPPQTRVPRIAAAPPMDGNLDAWPRGAAEVLGTDANLATHLYFPGSWHGPNDLSARVRLAHDGTKLYFGIEVHDDVLTAKDDLGLYFSTANYRKWLPQNLPFEQRFAIALPLDKPSVTTSGAMGFTCTARRTPTGYVAEGSVDMKELGAAPGSTLGWVVQLSEDDNTPHLMTSNWARKAAMVIPNSPTFAYYSDARTCCQLVFDK
jgi:hypothetical protein